VRLVALPGTTTAGSRGTERGGRWQLIPVLTQAGMACGGISTAAGGLQAEAALMAAVGDRGRERGKWLGGARHRVG
jgi:hypothetical protein